MYQRMRNLFLAGYGEPIFVNFYQSYDKDIAEPFTGRQRLSEKIFRQKTIQNKDTLAKWLVVYLY